MKLKYRILLLILLCILLSYLINNKKELFTSNYKINYEDDNDYKNRVLINNLKPLFKLDTYCINLKNREKNMKFIHNEWKDFLNIKRFIALDSATKSHVSILINIYNNYNNINFPIAIIEDDVYRRNNFTEYWNEILKIDNCDYICFDAFFLKFRDSQKNIHPKFISLIEHRVMGFTVYYKRFFEKFKHVDDLKAILSGTIDMGFTHNPNIINFTPKKQVCRQIVNKHSTTANMNTNFQINFYNIAEKLLNDL
jgi:hypothetical protein